MFSSFHEITRKNKAEMNFPFRLPGKNPTRNSTRNFFLKL